MRSISQLANAFSGAAAAVGAKSNEGESERSWTAANEGGKVAGRCIGSGSIDSG